MNHSHSGWIWLKDPVSVQETPVFGCFRKEMTLASVPGSFPVRICADGRYKLYCNGAFCEAGPCKSDNHLRYYDEVELAPYLHTGSNVVAIVVLHYPPQQCNHSVFCTPTPGVWLQSLTCDPLSGIPLLQTDATWQAIQDTGRRIVSENPFFAPLQIYESCTPCKEISGWTAPGFLCTWPNAVEYDLLDLSPVLYVSVLRPRPIPFLQRTRREFAGQAVPFRVGPYSTVSVVLDAGELTTGYLFLRLAGGAGAGVELLQAECYLKKVPLHYDNYRDHPEKGDRTDASGILAGYADHYAVLGTGTESRPEEYEPFWFRTFRYLKLSITTKAEPLAVLGLDYEETGYPPEVQTQVETSDPEMHRIWEISERSLRRCMHETYEDCPYYEQMQYAMDSRSQILFTYAIAADDRLARQCMEAFRRSVRPNGLLNASYPNIGNNIIPGFSVYYIGMLYDHMMYFGDAALLCRHLPTVDGILSYFHNHLTPQGLVDKIGDIDAPHPQWSFIDWAEEWDATRGVPPATLQGPLTMESLLYLLGLQYAVAICRYLGQGQTAQRYQSRADALRQAINRCCRNPDGIYRDGPQVQQFSQHCQVFAVLTGTCTPEEGRANLLQTLKHPEQYARCSVAMMPYLFRALEQCDLYEQTQALWSTWRKMLQYHLTTCAEDLIRQRSDCHAWGALALYELPSVVLGVRPAAPGYAKVSVHPHPAQFRWAKGTVITPRGKVFVEWHKKADETLEVNVSADNDNIIFC